MPSKRKGTSVTSEDDEDYRTKRDRNNQVSSRKTFSFVNLLIPETSTYLIYLNTKFVYIKAVKRSRVKSKQRTQLTQAKVKDLKVKNQVMEEKIKNLTKDLKFLKDLFLAQAQTKAEKLTNAELRRLLAGNILSTHCTLSDDASNFVFSIY